MAFHELSEQQWCHGFSVRAGVMAGVVHVRLEEVSRRSPVELLPLQVDGVVELLDIGTSGQNALVVPLRLHLCMPLALAVRDLEEVGAVVGRRFPPAVVVVPVDGVPTDWGGRPSSHLLI